MKKLIAMIGAVATAFGLYAADPTLATTFETGDAGVDGTTLTLGTGDGASGWTGLEEATLELGTYSGDAYTYGTPSANTRRETFDAKGDNAQFLKLETGAKTISHEIGAKVIDQLVKFTGFEEVQTNFVDGTKIAVWMTAIEQEGTPEIPQIGTAAVGEEGQDGYVPASEDYQAAVPASTDYVAGETNLYVTVGDGAKAINVQIDPASIGLTEFKPDTWYRLTIKSIGNVIADNKGVEYTQDGFLIYIDGKQVAMVEEPTWHINSSAFKDSAAKSYTDKQLFTAIANGAAEKIATLGFTGIGAADDIFADDDGPEFCQSVAITEDALNAIFTGAKAVLVKQNGDVIPLEAGVYTVKPGNKIVVTYGPNGPYVVTPENAYATYNVALDGTLTKIDAESDIKVVAAAAQIVDANDVTNYVAETELFAAVALVKDGDEITFLQGCSVTNGTGATLYQFAIGTTIDVKEGGDWDIEVPGEAVELHDYIGVMPEKQVEVSFPDDSETSALYLTGNIYGNGRKDTLLKVNGITLLEGDITVGDTFAAEDGFGAVLESDMVLGWDGDVIIPGSAKITLVGKGKVVTTTQLIGDDFNAFTNEKEDIEVSEPDANGFITYQIKQAPQGGFMVIIAGQGPQYYETLAEAVEKAPAGATIQLLENGAATAKVDVTKNLTVDLNGFTLSAATDTSSLFVIKDATLTINGTTEGSALVGRLNVGDSVYAGGVRTAHWDGALVINGGDYSVGNGQTVIHVNGDCLNAAVTINDATLTSPTDNGVQFNGKGTFAINNSTINGATAVYMKAGTLAIDKDSVINATAATWTAPSANHNGSNPTGDAIVMDSITGYQGEIELTIADGATVTSVAGATIRETITDAEDSATVKINAPSIAGIALTEAFLAKVAGGSAQLPGYVAAIGTVPYQTLQAAITAAGAKATVKLIANAVENVTVAADKDITLDLNGKTLTGATATYAIVNSGVVTIKGGTVQNKVTNHNSLICNKPVGYMTIENGTFICDRITIKNDEDGKGVYGTLVINGGTFTASKETGTDLVWDAVQNWGDATINGGTFDGYIECRAESNWNAGVMEINGGTFNKPVQTVVVFDAQKAPAANAADVALTINGGTFNDMVMRVADVKAKAGEAANVRVDFDETMPDYVASCKTLGTLVIPGMVGDPAALNPALFANDESVFCENGFKTVKLEGADYYSVAQSAPEVAVAKIGDKGYPTLQAAIDAAQTDETVELLQNIELATGIVITDKTMTLDFGGFTVSEAAEFSGSDIITVSGGSVTLMNGVVNHNTKVVSFTNGANVNIPAGMTFNSNGTYKFVVVKVGTFNFAGTIVNTGTEIPAMLLEGTAGEGGIVNINDGAAITGNEAIRVKTGEYTLNINGGTLTASSYATIYAYKANNTSTINITDGVLISDCGIFQLLNNPAKPENDSVNVTVTPFDSNCKAKFSTVVKGWDALAPNGLYDHCADGYTLVKGGDNYYTVVKAYNVTIAPTENGTVETSVTNGIVEGTEVTITATPATDYAVDTIAVTNGDQEVAVDGGKFTMPAGNVTVYVTFKSTAQPQQGWSEDPTKDVGKAADEVYPAIAASSVLAKVDAGTLGGWAKANSVDFNDFIVDPDTFENAFLLDCAPGEVETEKAKFKFTEIVPGTQPTIGEAGKYGNGKVVVYGATKLGADADWEINKEGATFYKAKLVPVQFNENAAE